MRAGSLTIKQIAIRYSRAESTIRGWTYKAREENLKGYKEKDDWNYRQYQGRLMVEMTEAAAILLHRTYGMVALVKGKMRSLRKNK